MSQEDYYTILGVNRDATSSEIKSAFRRLAMKHHPDRNPGDKDAEAKFKRVKEAYDVLSDDRKRAAYDQFGHAGVSGGMGSSGAAGGFDFGDVFGDIFGDIFGGGRGSGAGFAERGADLRYNLELSLEEAVFGKTIEIQIPTLLSCEGCKGTGAREGSSASTCNTCGGYGQVRMQQGFFTIQQTCPTCRGQGKIILNPCFSCHGQGRKQGSRTLSVNVPAGIDTGDRIRLAGQGESGAHSGQPGDLYVEVHIKPHPIFTREGNHLHCQIPISFSVAALGGEIEVPTLQGKVKLKIEAGTQTGRVYRLRNKGVVPVRGGQNGDLLCSAMVETPINLSRKQKELLQQFEESLASDNINHHPKESTWFDGVKRFFEDMKS